MKRAIVTGGAGFIGSHLADRLLAEGFAVTVLDNLSTGLRANVRPDVEFIEADMAGEDAYAKLPKKGVEAVFHLAAQSSGEVSFEDPLRDMRANIEGSLRLLQWCKARDVAKFLFSSSMTAYGVSGEEPVDEGRPLLPKSFYGVAKAAAEGYARVYANMGANMGAMETSVLRLFNVYGSRQNLANMKQGMASIYMAYLLRGEPIVVKGSLDRFRDQTHVSDVVEAFMAALRREGGGDRTWNVAAGRKTTVRELIETMLEVAGQDPAAYPIEPAPGTPGDLFGCVADVAKAKRELGWEAKTSLREGLREMHQSYAGGARHG